MMTYHIRKIKYGSHHPEVKRNPLIPQMSGPSKGLHFAFGRTDYLS